MPYSSMGRGMMVAGGALAQGITGRQERKEREKQEKQLLEGVSKIMEHPAVAHYFPEDFDPYAVGAQGTMAALNMVSQGLQMEQQEHQTATARMQREQAERGISEEDRFMQQLHQHSLGVGEGVYRPEVVDRYRQMLEQSPMAAAAGATGMRPETLQRYGVGMPEEGASGFSPEDMGVPRPIPGAPGQFFVPTGRGGGQVIRTEREEMTAMQRDLAAVDQERSQAGLPPLTPDQRVQAMQEYTTRRVQGSPQEDLMRQILNRQMQKAHNIEPPSRDMFGGGADPGTVLEPPRPDEARQKVFERFGW